MELNYYSEILIKFKQLFIMYNHNDSCMCHPKINTLVSMVTNPSGKTMPPLLINLLQYLHLNGLVVIKIYII